MVSEKKKVVISVIVYAGMLEQYAKTRLENEGLARYLDFVAEQIAEHYVDLALVVFHGSVKMFFTPYGDYELSSIFFEAIASRLVRIHKNNSPRNDFIIFPCAEGGHTPEEIIWMWDKVGEQFEFAHLVKVVAADFHVDLKAKEYEVLKDINVTPVYFDTRASWKTKLSHRLVGNILGIMALKFPRFRKLIYATKLLIQKVRIGVLNRNN